MEDNKLKTKYLPLLSPFYTTEG